MSLHGFLLGEAGNNADENAKCRSAGVAFHPNCNYIATGGTDRTVRVWDAATGSLVRLLRGHVTGVTAVGFSPDGKHLVSGACGFRAAMRSLHREISVGYCCG